MRNERIARTALFASVAVVLLCAGEPPARGSVAVEHDAVLARVPAHDERAASAALAREYIARSRRDGDPRYLGLAEGVLNQLPVDGQARVLRATILQSRHDFAAALVELELVLRDGEDAQARLTEATVLTVLAEYDRARASCRKLPPSVYAAACEASIDALTGRHERARRSLERVPNDAWALSLLGEQAYWLGERERATELLTRALRLEDDRYTRGVLDDLRLERGERAQGDELHRALSELAAGEAGDEVRKLEQSFAESEARGDRVHRREQSRFWLARGERALALRLAQENWQVQREPWDARVLLEAARTRAEAAPALAWLERTQFASPYLRSLAEGLQP